MCILQTKRTEGKSASKQVPSDLWMVVGSGAGKEKSRMNLNSRCSSAHYLYQVLPLQGDGLGAGASFALGGFSP